MEYNVLLPFEEEEANDNAAGFSTFDEDTAGLSTLVLSIFPFITIVLSVVFCGLLKASFIDDGIFIRFDDIILNHITDYYI